LKDSVFNARCAWARKTAEATQLVLAGHTWTRLVIAGPSELKSMVQAELPPDLRRKAIVVDTGGVLGLVTVHEALAAAAPQLGLRDLQDERKLLSAFMTFLRLHDDSDQGQLAAIGWREVQEAVRQNAAARILLAEDALSPEDAQWLTTQQVEISPIQSRCPEAEQFRMGFGGVAAYLRFPVAFDDSASSDE
jgi:peptide subunit release factor 1 (eRF1)